MILDWRTYVLRSDIRNLPLEEQRRQFLKEQLYYDNLLSEQRQLQYQLSQIQSQGGRTLNPNLNSPFNTRSLLFDGIDDYVDCGNDSSLNLSSNVSVSLWFKGSNVSDFQYLFSKLYYRLLIKPVLGGTQLIWEVYYTASQLTKVTLFTNFADGNWHHVVATYESGVSLGQKLYVDGQLLGEINSQSQIYTSSIPFLIGAKQTTSIQGFEGLIDEVGLFNTILSASDVTAIYGSGVPTSLSSYSSLVSWWRCGDGDTAPTLTDNGSGGNNGTINGATIVEDVPS